MGILKIRNRTGVKKLSLPGWQISCILSHNKGRILVTSSYPERAEDGYDSLLFTPLYASTRVDCLALKIKPPVAPVHFLAQPRLGLPAEKAEQQASRQKDRLGLPERCGCSGRRCRWCSWLPASSPASVWIRLTTSLLATRPGSAGSRGRRRNRLQRLETPEAPPAEHAPAQCLSRASVGGCEGSSGFGLSRHAMRGGAKRGDVVPVGKGGAEDYEGSRLGAVEHAGHPRYLVRLRREDCKFETSLGNFGRPCL
ncbi:uncharacterized protein LOC124093037 [Marmota monax]|uniref:uncharacterized protein LOC124093037 n=1 Tax=Marmota monax TaxID=9995 RepID=UPI0026EC929D|nr:uncharacterized protein LOC124093037 [Marmota monax]